MAMPVDLVLVRHGQSVGNLIQGVQRKNKKLKVPSSFYKQHTYEWRLTQLGVEQAFIAGEWIRKNIGTKFDRYYSSSYVRAQETAGHLNLPGAQWFLNPYLGERNWGILDRFTPEEREKRFAQDFKAKKINVFYWAPPRGESMLDLCLRVDRVLDTLHRECSGKRVVMINHGEIMWTHRFRLERMTVSQYLDLNESKHPFDRIHNCQVIHYTRRDPKTGKIAPYLNWMRSVCPTDLSLSLNKWVKIKRRSYSNEELLAFAEKFPRLIEG